MLLALSYPAKAQQPNKIPRIGFVSGTDPKNPGPTVEAFQQGLRDRGYVDQQNLVIEYRYGQDMNERSPAVVAELVQLNVDVLVVGGPPGNTGSQAGNQNDPHRHNDECGSRRGWDSRQLGTPWRKYHRAHQAHPGVRW